MTAERIAELRQLLADTMALKGATSDGRNTADTLRTLLYRSLPELLDTAERLVMVQAELDVLRGVACEEGQAMGRGRCGACVCCLRAACARKDAYIGAACNSLDGLGVEDDYNKAFVGAREEVGKR